MILLHPHVLTWLTAGNPQLGRRARQLANEVLAADRLGVSAITFWETAMLHQCERIRLVQPVQMRRQEIMDQRVSEVPLTGEVCYAALTTQYVPS